MTKSSLLGLSDEQRSSMQTLPTPGIEIKLHGAGFKRSDSEPFGRYPVMPSSTRVIELEAKLDRGQLRGERV